jgi:hypothetical protein
MQTTPKTTNITPNIPKTVIFSFKNKYANKSVKNGYIPSIAAASCALLYFNTSKNNKLAKNIVKKV